MFRIIKCYEQGCEYSCYTMTELQNHHLLMHERALPVNDHPVAIAVDAAMKRIRDAQIVIEERRLLELMASTKPVQYPLPLEKHTNGTHVETSNS